MVAEDSLRLRRIMARDGLTEDYARARLAAQPDQQVYRAACDDILENSGTKEQLLAQCQALLARLA